MVLIGELLISGLNEAAHILKIFLEHARRTHRLLRIHALEQEQALRATTFNCLFDRVSHIHEIHGAGLISTCLLIKEVAPRYVLHLGLFFLGLLLNDHIFLLPLSGFRAFTVRRCALAQGLAIFGRRSFKEEKVSVILILDRLFLDARTRA